MSIINHIYDKLNEWNSKRACTMDAKRIILGRKTIDYLHNEIRDLIGNLKTYNPVPDENAPHGRFCGMKISLSKRPNYVRILPEKMKYRTIKKGIYKNYSHPSIALAHWNKP